MELEKEGSGHTAASIAQNPDNPLNEPLPKPSGKKYFIVIFGLLVGAWGQVYIFDRMNYLPYY